MRLLYGHMSYETALLVLLLTPEAYLPLRAVGSQFHASMEGAAAADRVLEILDIPPAGPPGAVAGGPVWATAAVQQVTVRRAVAGPAGRFGLGARPRSR